MMEANSSMFASTPFCLYDACKNSRKVVDI